MSRKSSIRCSTSPTVSFRAAGRSNSNANNKSNLWGRQPCFAMNPENSINGSFSTAFQPRIGDLSNNLNCF